MKKFLITIEFQFFYSLFLLILFTSCDSKNTASEENKLFTLLSPSETGIEFENNLTYTEAFNPYTFRNFYNGGGVAIGDINNDSLPDIFFCSNQGTNKLFLNKGKLKFEDITEKAGLISTGVWSTGVTLADINGDNWLDIYICKSGDPEGTSRSNALYINNGNLTFTEKTKEFGLENLGLSTHAAFFDYDNDGDVDCYLLNNSFRSVGNYDLIPDQRNIPDPRGGNKLYRNDDNFFVDVTEDAGIFSSEIGFGLGVTISDINKDGWMDIYVSNDFFERDYLYINQQNGLFQESLEKYVRELSMNSMGADIADVNNDGFPEIYVTDMLPDNEARIKTKTTFENWDKYSRNIESGYYKQFIRNTLQLHSGISLDSKDKQEAFFSEIGRFSGVSATDWSWGALITDLDNDGLKDIFVANGIFQDLTDQDYVNYAFNAADQIRTQITNKEDNIITRLVDLIPSEPIANFAFSNNGDLTFTNKAREWGLATPGFSNGAAYGDLDNDGDLDLVVNNVNMPGFIYKNQSRELYPDNNYLKISLKGADKNTFGIGSKVTLYYNNTLSYQEQMPMRGFQSTVDERLNFGLGKAKLIDSLVVEWPGGKMNVLKNIPANQHLIINQREAVQAKRTAEPVQKPLFTASKDNYGLDFVHQENDFVDFDRSRLIFHMLSADGPRMAKGDLNNDGLEDIYICAAKEQAGVLYVQQSSGRFLKSNEAVLEEDKLSEDTDALFFDADGDGDQDLYVCSGGSEFSPNAAALIDRLYINQGDGKFIKSKQVLPSFVFESSSSVSAGDFDGDGDQDLFVGVRLKPFSYGYACKAYILGNDGHGIFKDVTNKIAPELELAGMVTDGEWFDYDQDGKPDLVIAGEYMPIRIFHNSGGKLYEITEKAGLSRSNGWWNRLAVADVNGDGFPDIVAANHGLNSRFKASEQKPVSMYVSDFDNNGTVEHILTCYNKDQPYPMVLRHDLVAVLPALKKKYLKYESYKEQQIEDIFTSEQLRKARKLDAFTFESSLILNNGNGTFKKTSLPTAAQLSPMYGISVADFDRDGKADILMGGNFYQAKPEVGIYDASYGTFLKGNGSGGFNEVKNSGLFTIGAVRDVAAIKSLKKNLILISKNNDRLQIVLYEK